MTQRQIKKFVQATLWGCQTQGKIDPKKARSMLAHLELQLSHVSDYVKWGQPGEPDTENAYEAGDLLFAAYEALHGALGRHARRQSNSGAALPVG